MFSSLSLFDASIILIYLIVCLIIGIINAGKVKTLKDFALGTFNFSSTNILVCIIFASSIGAGSILGVSEKIYLFGLFFVIKELLKPLQWLVAAKIFAPNIEKFKGCFSVSQVMYKLYGVPGRWVTNIASLLMGLGMIAAQASAIGYVFHYFFNVDIAYGIFISYAVLTFYSLLGGIKSIIPSEVFKAIIFFLIFPISLIKAFSTFGGLDVILSKLPDTHVNFDFSYSNILIIVSFILFSLLPEVSSPLVQRYLMAPNAKELKKTFIRLACVSFPFAIILSVIVYMVKAFAPDIPGNEVFLYYIANFLPIGVKGLMIAGLMAIIMAMAESWLNSTSVIIVNDIFKVLFPNMSDKKQLVALRLSVALLSLGSIAIVLYTKGILELIWLVQNFWYPIIAIPIYAGFLGFKSNSKSFIVSVISAMLCTMLGRYITGEFAIMSLGFGIIGSTIGLFGAHYFQFVKNKLGIVEQPKLKNNVKRSIKLVFNNIITNYKTHLTSIFKERISLHQMKIESFCGFVFTYYILYFLNSTTYYGHQIFHDLLIWVYVLSLTLLFKDFMFPKTFIRKYFHLYWYLVLTFCLPLVSSYMIFVSRGDDLWLLGSIISGLALFYFVDSIKFVILCSVGTIGGFVLFKFTEAGLEPSSLAPAVKSISYIYMFMISAALVYFRQKEKEHELKVETMEIFSGAMAHEVRSPLAAMQMNSEQLQMMLSDVFASKVKNKNGGYDFKFSLDEEDFELMEMLANSLVDVSQKGIKTVDGLLTTMKTNTITDDDKINNINKCVDDALADYGTTNSFVKQVDFKSEENFEFFGSYHYFKHVLSNILNNAQKYGGAGVKVEMWTEDNKLFIRDNGKGIPYEKMGSERFYTDNKSGTGIGLPFCKMIMESLGGDIECESELNEYTMFILTFPKVTQKQVEEQKQKEMQKLNESVSNE